MKKNLLLFLLATIVLKGLSQPVIKIFAYKQENSPGMVRAGVKDENGNPVKKAAAQMNYFIFLSSGRTTKITPTQIFIRGKSFSIDSLLEKDTPVEYTDNSIPKKEKKIVLVPRTNNKVVEVKIVPSKKNFSMTSYLKKLTKTNDLVIGYIWHKKKYFLTRKSFRTLNPRVNE